MTKPTWSTACLDWERRIVAGESLIPFAPLYPQRAREALEIFKDFRLIDVAGRPLVGDVTREWVFDLVQAIFGAYDVKTGMQLLKEILLLISKKNTKSTLAALIMLTVMILNWRYSAEFAILAPTKEVAKNSYNPMRDAIRFNPRLNDLFQVQEHTKTITHRVTGATLKVIAAESDSLGGGKYSVVLVDELWLFGKDAKAENMLLEATGGLASRDEGFVLYLTTQSDEPPAGVFKKQLDYARGVRDGRIVDAHYLPILYEYPQWMLDKGMHKDPQYFYITNPNLGASVSEEFLVRKFKKATEDGEESVRGLLAKHLNVEIGLALRSDRWAGADFWEAQATPGIDLDYILQHCEVVTVGIDGGGLDDLLGLSVVGREIGTRKWPSWSRAWAHPSVLARRKEIVSILQDFEKQGDVVLIDAMGNDVAEVADIVSQIHEAGLLDKIGVDPAGIGAVLDALIEAGIPEENIVGITQGYKMNGAIKTTERKLAEKVLWHGGQPLMAWCVGNAKVEPRGNAIVITKQVSGSAKIDPLMALFNAVSLMALNPGAEQVSDDDFMEMIRNPI